MKKRKKRGTQPKAKRRTQPEYKATFNGFTRNGTQVIVEYRNRSVSSLEDSIRT